ncbi:hypothetical protein P4S70_20390 [Enterovibrio sp. Hal110]
MVETDAVIQWLEHSPEERVELSEKNLYDALNWVLAHWPSLSNADSRTLTTESLRAVTRTIASVSTGKQRHYRKALQLITAYLHHQLHWILPERSFHQIKDKENRRVAEILSQEAQSSSLAQMHDVQLSKCLDSKEPLPVGAVIIEILLNLAPLPLGVLCDVMRNKGDITHHRIATYQLNIGKETEHYLRFLLLPRTEQVLRQLDSKNHTEKHIQNAISTYLTQAPFYLKSNDCLFSNIRDLALCHWYRKTSSYVMQDFMFPERQFALPPARFNATQKPAKRLGNQHTTAVYAPIKRHKETYETKRTSVKWPHRTLKKQHLNEDVLAQCDDILQWEEDNILPNFLMCYTAELLQFGGVKRDKLADSTISTYTHIEQHLSPLTKTKCFDEYALNAWVTDCLDNAPSPVIKEHLQRFFRFAAQHPLTDTIDRTLLYSAFEVPNVDVNTVTPTEFDHVLAALDNQKPPCFTQWLFARLAASLAFHGMLRRGEILRLRRKDVYQTVEHQHVFCLTIRGTSEGQTKSRRRREVYIALPKRESFLLKWLLAAKSSPDWLRAPLLALAGETLSQRAELYLLPVTQALRAVCGQASRFHHLRHGGGTLFFRQCMSFANKQYMEGTLLQSNYDVAVYSEAFIKARLGFWINAHQGSPNPARILDIFTRMIGHSDIATTRRHYLHGHEWLTLHQTPTCLTLTKTEVRNGLGLPPSHGDLSRQLRRLDAKTDGSKTVTISTARWLGANIRFYNPQSPDKALSHDSLVEQLSRLAVLPKRDKRSEWQISLQSACLPRWHGDNLVPPNRALPYIPWCNEIYRDDPLGAPLSKQLKRWLTASHSSNHLIALHLTTREKQRIKALQAYKTFRALKPELVIQPPIHALNKQLKKLEKETGLLPALLKTKKTEPGCYLRFKLHPKRFAALRALLLTGGNHEC